MIRFPMNWRNGGTAGYRKCSDKQPAEDQKIVITLRDLHGLSYEEIARIPIARTARSNQGSTGRGRRFAMFYRQRRNFYTVITSNNVKGGLETMNCADVRKYQRICGQRTGCK